MSDINQIPPKCDELDKLDEFCSLIDSMNIEQLEKIIKYCEEQRVVASLIEKRRKSFAEQLRIERIKWKKELNNVKKIKREDSFEESTEEEEIKPKKIK